PRPSPAERSCRSSVWWWRQRRRRRRSRAPRRRTSSRTCGTFFYLQGGCLTLGRGRRSLIDEILESAWISPVRFDGLRHRGRLVRVFGLRRLDRVRVGGGGRLGGGGRRRGRGGGGGRGR